jgi:hypothetical protein
MSLKNIIYVLVGITYISVELVGIAVKSEKRRLRNVRSKKLHSALIKPVHEIVTPTIAWLGDGQTSVHNM